MCVTYFADVINQFYCRLFPSSSANCESLFVLKLPLSESFAFMLDSGFFSHRNLSHIFLQRYHQLVVKRFTLHTKNSDRGEEEYGKKEPREL